MVTEAELKGGQKILVRGSWKGQTDWFNPPE
jgi:hypothetical protein